MDDRELIQALGKIEAGEHAAALVALEDLLKYDTDDVDALNLSGVAALLLGNIEAAEQFFGMALESDPHDFIAWGERGRCHFLRGDYSRAAECLSKASALFDDSSLHIKSQYQLLKGQAELYSGDLKGSVHSFETACILNGKDALLEIGELAEKCASSKRIPLASRREACLLLKRVVRKYSREPRGKTKVAVMV